MKLTAIRGCARFGMDDGYMVGPRDLIFKVLVEFAKGIREEIGCELVARKCRMYIMDAGAWQECIERNLIPEEMSLMDECIYVNEDGDTLRGDTVFNVPVGEPEYFEAVQSNKAREVASVARNYIEDMEEDCPHKLWFLLQYSLQHIHNHLLVEDMHTRGDVGDSQASGSDHLGGLSCGHGYLVQC